MTIEKTSKTQHLKLNHNYNKNTKLIKQKKLTAQLQAFVIIGNLSNATNDESVQIIALAMYNRLGLFNPSNEFIQNYKNKDILQKYKNIQKKD